MTIDDAIEKINKYQKRDNVGAIVVDVQNKADLDALLINYRLPQNNFINVSDAEFCCHDELPKLEDLLDKLSHEKGTFFIRELSTFYLLKGEKALKEMLLDLLSLNIAGHVIVITYQCANHLKILIDNDTRLENRINIVEGTSTAQPKLVFTLSYLALVQDENCIKGIDRIAWAIETEISSRIFVETSKNKETFSRSLYSISELKHPYDILCQMDDVTKGLSKDLGSEEDWQYAVNELIKYSTWYNLISNKIGSTQNLNVAVSNYMYNKTDKQWLWLYLVGLKLYGASDDWCLNSASISANSTSEFIRNIYRCILDIDPRSNEFASYYERRKIILKALGNPEDELADFCKIVLSKEKDALYYLTDNTIQEKELIIQLLNEYGDQYDKDKLLDILKIVYLDLWNYLSPYRFKNELLDGYFQDYKYQKVINKIAPEFKKIVEQQAINRDYNAILQPRSAITENIDRTQAQTYFIDAMGVEYLGFILSRCNELSLMAKVSVCRCELPSLTCFNKEFWDLFSSEQFPILSVSDLDEIKHHGKYNYNYEKDKRPIHLIKELEIIDKLIHKIKTDMIQSKYSKAILISDHGASRLAVINEKEILWEMKANGNHSGRCCPKSEVDEQPEKAVDTGDFWVLANYDRFKGSRKANVEVHGGATLEEVTVPIIEITSLPGKIEVKLMPIDSPATFTGMPEIIVSYRKPAAIKLYISQKVENVTIEIDGHIYDAKRIDDYYYSIDSMPEVRRKGIYNVDVFACDNKIAAGLPLNVKKESGSEKSLL